MPLCACGCAQPVATPGAKWKRGHFHRGEAPTRLRPLPDTEDEAMAELDEEIDLGEPPELPGQPWDGNGGGPEDFGEIPPDALPADLGDSGKQRRRGAPRVTATIRKDINAKISLGLELPGRIWQARDPWCGGAFIHQRPAIADALTDIVCDSADLVDWFTGPAGGFMKYLKLAAALQPVAVVVYGHHVTHTIGEKQGQREQPDMSRYAA